MTDDELYDAITGQRLRFIELLETLTDAEWDTPSLCSGWRVREVVGHLVSILDIPRGRFLRGVLGARSFDRFADRAAREYGARPPSELLALYGSHATARFAPPLIGPRAPLCDVHVHTLDVARALGRPVDLDPDRVRAALDWLCGGRAYGFVPAKRTRGLRFEAHDLGWSAGSGPTVAGHSHDLLLAVTGRPEGIAALSGDGAAGFASRFA